MHKLMLSNPDFGIPKTLPSIAVSLYFCDSLLYNMCKKVIDTDQWLINISMSLLLKTLFLNLC